MISVKIRSRVLSIALFSLVISCLTLPAYAADPVTCWFPPGWKAKAPQAREIVTSLSEESGVALRPRIAGSYPEILEAFASGEPNLVYVGSFVQAVLKARDIGVPLVQSLNGKEMYSGVLIYRKGEDPQAILKNAQSEIAYAVGASSGESSAKAATGGKASIGVPNHGAACGAVKAGKAKAAVVKNWWWEANAGKFPSLAMYEIPGISVNGNPDNVLTASKAVPEDVRKKIIAAAMAKKDVFGAKEIEKFDVQKLEFPLSLMKKGKIDPLTYSW